MRLSQRYPEDARINEALGALYRMKREPQRAGPYLEKAARLAPSAHVYTQLGTNYAELGREQEAVEAFRKALALEPGNVEANYALARLYLKRDRFAQAAPLLERVLRARPATAEPAYLLAVCYSSLGRPAQARHVLLALPAKEREREEVQLALGTACLALGRRAEAQASFGHALRLNPASLPAAVNLGAMLVAGGQLEHGLELLEEAWRSDHSSYLAGYNLALAYHKKRDFRAARGVLDTLLIHGETAELYNLLGEVEAELNDNQTALKHLERAVQLEPNEANLFSLGYRLLQLWMLEPAVEVLRRGTKQFSGSARMWMALGCAYFAQHRDNEAIDADLRATEHGDDPRAYRFLAEAYQALNMDRADVAARFHRYRLAHPNEAWANFYDGYGLLRAGRLDPALPLLQRAVQLDPKLAEAQFQLGNIYMRQRRMDEAIAAYQAAVSGDPDYMAAYYRLGLACLRVGRREEGHTALARHDELVRQQAAKNDARQQTIESIYRVAGDK